MKVSEELLIIPRIEIINGFTCPICLSTFNGIDQTTTLDHCPDCGQHIEINTDLFIELKEKVQELPEEDKNKICEYNAYIGINGRVSRWIAGIYKARLDKRIGGADGEDCIDA